MNEDGNKTGYCLKNRCIEREILRLRLPQGFNPFMANNPPLLCKEEGIRKFEENKKNGNYLRLSN